MKAQRKLASAVADLVALENATPLVVSRRAQAIGAALENRMALPSLRNACSKAHIPETEYAIQKLVKTSMGRDAPTCIRLTEVCRALKPHLVDPRGRMPSEVSVMHELQLYILDEAYTYDSVNNVFSDAATRATCIAMNIKNFGPRPARRRLRKRQESRGQAQKRPH